MGWWRRVAGAESVVLDEHEHYEKMTERNRYRISGANNSILLSIPLESGRDQRLPMRHIQIANSERWQVQHWRTLVSVYNRSPYFEHYEPGLERLFTTEYTHLVAFNKAAMEWAMLQLKPGFELKTAGSYVQHYPADHLDLRKQKTYATDTPIYHQIFMDRLGFLPNLSILDLLFSEGPAAAAWIRKHALRG